jgi:hypothetical protein
MKKKIFVLGWLDKPNKPTKKGSLSFVLCESPFTSVSIVSRGHRSLVSLQTSLNYQRTKICRRCQWHPGEQILAIVNKKEGKKIINLGQRSNYILTALWKITLPLNSDTGKTDRMTFRSKINKHRELP